MPIPRESRKPLRFILSWLGSWIGYRPNSMEAKRWSLRVQPPEHFPKRPDFINSFTMNPRHLLSVIPAALLGVLIGYFLFPGNIVFTVIIGVVTTSGIAGPLVSRSNARRLQNLLVDARFQICPWCAYDLSDRLRDNEHCPECGHHATRRDVVRYWGHYFTNLRIMMG